MGDFRVRKINDIHDRRQMYQHVLADVEAFEWMLKKDIFDEGPLHIGAEQELCIVDKGFSPSTNALEILDGVADEHYTNELALFNLEINLDPLPLQDNCFSGMESSLLELLQKGRQQAKTHNDHILMAGILPTLKYRHLQFDYMTPEQRYQTISESFSELRGEKFEIHLQGVDELIMSLGSVLFEACNTSFQLHLQIRPKDFVNQHNWSQMISGPVLAACANSPLLFGNELWAETRVALFKQSLDTRSSKKYLRKKLPRVYFGNNWLQKSAAELWKNDVMRFPLIVTSDDFQDAKALLKRGEIPNLRAIRLHNGTTYTWNRLCYGFSSKTPHLRIECRYLPAGPTAIDEIANFAFWIGLMKAEPEGGVEFWKKQDFRVAKDNFIKGARNGLNTVFEWYGKKVPAKQLILETLLPMAEQGLRKCNVSAADTSKYLSILEKRVQTENTGAEWTVRNFRKLAANYSEAVAEKEIVRQMLAYQNENTPICQWKDMPAKIHSFASVDPTVEQIMTNDVISTSETASIALARNILKWKGIHHLPIENKEGDLMGLITDGIMDRYDTAAKSKTYQFAKDIMLTELITIEASASIQDAKELMDNHQLSGLPVVYDKKLVGMITKNDLKKLFLQTDMFTI